MFFTKLREGLQGGTREDDESLVFLAFNSHNTQKGGGGKGWQCVYRESAVGEQQTNTHKEKIFPHRERNIGLQKELAAGDPMGNIFFFFL